MKMIPLRGERGAAAVEFAMIAVVFLMIVFGIIEFGILMFNKHVLTNASREGARAGIVMRAPRLPDSAITTIVDRYSEENMVTFGTPNDPITVVKRPWTEETPPRAPIFGDELVVTVTYDFDFLILSIVGLGPIPLKAESRMRME